MNTVRLAGIPIDHVVAEVAAFPLSSEAALACSLSEFDPELKEPTRALWRDAEKHLLNTSPSFSVEEVIAVRDSVWFHLCHGERLPLTTYLRHLAREYLEPRGDHAVPRLLDSHKDYAPAERGSLSVMARTRWRWLSFALPPDLLLAALGKNSHRRWGKSDAEEQSGVTAMPGVIKFLSPALEQTLSDRGFAETHCHIGAAIEFPVLWVGAMFAIASLQLDPAKFRSPGSQLEEGQKMADWLVRAAIARYVLAAYLCARRDGEGLDGYFGRLRDRFEDERSGVDASVLRSALVDLYWGSLGSHDFSFREYQGLYARLTDIVYACDKPDQFQEVYSVDPVSEFFPPLGHQRPTPEMRFVSAGLEYLDTVPDDQRFAKLFWQTLRVRAIFYRHVVQRPLTPGLQWFIRFYSRIKPSRGPLEDVMLASAEELCGARQGLRSLEVRTSPDPDQTQLKKYVQMFHAHARKSTHPCEYGLVLHFTKDRGGGMMQGNPMAYGGGSVADPLAMGAGSGGYRYGKFYREKRREALSFAWVLRSFPLSLQVLRGLDICTDELGVPTWVLLPLIEHVRKAGRLASSLLRQELDLSVPPLRTTVHVGEDFVHLLSGLRHVDEALRFLELREGDRMGHALALGVDPREWSARRSFPHALRGTALRPGLGMELVRPGERSRAAGPAPPSGARHLSSDGDGFRPLPHPHPRSAPSARPARPGPSRL